MGKSPIVAEISGAANQKQVSVWELDLKKDKNANNKIRKYFIMQNRVFVDEF